MDTAPINFYGHSDPYFEFSNFYRRSIRVAGKVWPTTEHYFQAQKYLGTSPNLVEEVRQQKTPGLAAKLGRDRSKPLRKDWERVKIDAMRQALRAKFTQHEDLKQLLLGTGERKLVEHTTKDSFWGDGGDGSGENWLGRLLMELREDLRNGPERGY